MTPFDVLSEVKQRSAEAVIAQLAAVGIGIDEVTDKLLRDGLTSFAKSFDTLIAGLERKTVALGGQLTPARG